MKADVALLGEVYRAILLVVKAVREKTPREKTVPQNVASAYIEHHRQ